MSIISYLKEVNAETKNIKWPTKKVTTYFTVGVILISILFAVYIGLLDFVFTEIVNEVIINKDVAGEAIVSEVIINKDVAGEAVINEVIIDKTAGELIINE